MRWVEPAGKWYGQPLTDSGPSPGALALCTQPSVKYALLIGGRFPAVARAWLRPKRQRELLVHLNYGLIQLLWRPNLKVENVGP
jgi:hypothetical protein